MPKMIPEWAYGKYRIIADDINCWRVEKYEGFWYGWRNAIMEFRYTVCTPKIFSSVEIAKHAIYEDIRCTENQKIEEENKKEWLKKNPPIIYP